MKLPLMWILFPINSSKRQVTRVPFLVSSFLIDSLPFYEVREAFVDRTVLTIAHRLPTIIDMDRFACVPPFQLSLTASPHTGS